MLGKVGVEAGEVIVLSRDSRGSGRAGVEDLSIDPLGGLYTALDHGDTFVEDVVNVGAGLGVTLPVKVANWVVVGVADVVFCPVALDDAVGVLLIAIIFWGIFYCHYATE